MNCPLCSLAQSPEEKIYEDEHVFCILNTGAAQPGHLFIIPKIHATVIEQLDKDVAGYLFIVAANIAKAMFTALDIDGTNILLQNGTGAGQTTPHIMVQVIPRKKGDNIGLNWVPKKLEEEVLDGIYSQIKIALTPEVKEKPKPVEKKPVEHIDWNDSLMSHLKKRIP